MISLLLHKSEAKMRMSVNNKDIIRMYLGYNWLITQKTLPTNASGYVHLSKLLLILTIYFFDFFLGDIYLSVLGLISTYQSCG